MFFIFSSALKYEDAFFFFKKFNLSLHYLVKDIHNITMRRFNITNISIGIRRMLLLLCSCLKCM